MRNCQIRVHVLQPQGSPEVSLMYGTQKIQRHFQPRVKADLDPRGARSNDSERQPLCHRTSTRKDGRVATRLASTEPSLQEMSRYRGGFPWERAPLHRTHYGEALVALLAVLAAMCWQ